MVETVAQSIEDKWVVILVHGVGDSEPTDMIDSVAPIINAVQDPGRRPSDRYELIRLPEEDEETFPVFMRRDHVNGAAVVFAEVYWADLSRIRQGTVAFVFGVFQLIFGVRSIADQASAQPGVLALALRIQMRAVSALLRGPLFALYLFGTVYALGYALLDWMGFNHWEIAGRNAAVLSCVVGLLAIIVGFAGAWCVRNSAYWSRVPWLSLAGVGMLACGLSYITLTDPTPSATVLGPISRAVNQKYSGIAMDRPEFYLATLEWANEWLLWAISVIMLLALLPLVLAWRIGRKESQPALSAAYMAGALQTLLWVQAVAALDIVILGALTLKLHQKEAKPYWNALYQYYIFQTALVLVIGAAAIAVWIYRGRWTHGRDPALVPTPLAPRFIVAAAIEIALLASSFSFFLFTAFLPFLGAFDWQLSSPAATIFLWLLVVTLLAVVLLAPGPLRNVSHIAMDVINHFRVKKGQFPVRQRIDARFRSVLARVLAEEKPTRLLVIAHSQGTVIALDALDDPPCRELIAQANLRSENVALITFGSPYTHLYEHYFPSQYPTARGREILGAQVGHWANVFRIDDYVGTSINGLEDADRPVNHPIGPGGWGAHTTYWQKDVFEVVKDLLPGAPPATHSQVL